MIKTYTEQLRRIGIGQVPIEIAQRAIWCALRGLGRALPKGNQQDHPAASAGATDCLVHNRSWYQQSCESTGNCADGCTIRWRALGRGSNRL